MALKLNIKAGAEWQKVSSKRSKLVEYEAKFRDRIQDLNQQKSKSSVPAASPFPNKPATPSTIFGNIGEMITNFFEPAPDIPKSVEYKSHRPVEVIDLTAPTPTVQVLSAPPTPKVPITPVQTMTPKSTLQSPAQVSPQGYVDFSKPQKQKPPVTPSPAKVTPSPSPSTPMQTPKKKSSFHKTTTPVSAAKPISTSKTSTLLSAPELKNVDKKLLEVILNEIVDDKPDVEWDDIAGLALAKQTLYENVVLPSIRPDIFNGLRAPARGILLFGPPGNGKTLIAKAVASQCKATFFSISASSLVSKYHGEGEKLVKALFAAARYLQPSVIFVDEIDSILSARSSNEHEASRRMKTEFLVQMDGVNNQKSNDRVLLLAATNIPWDLDSAVQRRFVKKIHIPLPDKEARHALIKNIMADQKIQIKEKEMDLLVAKTEGYSGSDLKNLCSEAAMVPVRELGTKILNVKKEDVRPITYKDFEISMSQVKSSVAPSTLKELEKWNAMFGSQAN